MSKPFVAIAMGSDSDLPVMKASCAVLRAFGVSVAGADYLGTSNAQEICAKDVALQEKVTG